MTDQQAHVLTGILQTLSHILAPTKSYTRTQAVSGTSAFLAKEPCRRVTLQNNGNALLFKINGGDEFTAADPSSFEIEVTSTDMITVKGTGTLNYIVHK